jgi:hypothetical protein
MAERIVAVLDAQNSADIELFMLEVACICSTTRPQGIDASITLLARMNGRHWKVMSGQTRQVIN